MKMGGVSSSGSRSASDAVLAKGSMTSFEYTQALM
jgi:hypothetical protein